MRTRFRVKLGDIYFATRLTHGDIAFGFETFEKDAHEWIGFLKSLKNGDILEIRKIRKPKQ